MSCPDEGCHPEALEGCPSYDDLLWFVANVTHTPQKRVDMATHIKLCENCKETVAAMNLWVKENAEVCRQIDDLPLAALKKRLERALNEENANELTVIVERLCQTADFSVDILIEAAKKAPGIAQPHARAFLIKLERKINYQQFSPQVPIKE